MDEAVLHDHWNIVGWLLKNETSWGSISTFTAALESYQIDVATILYDRESLAIWPRAVHTGTLVELIQDNDSRGLAIHRHITERRRDRYLPHDGSDPMYPAEEEESDEDSDRIVDATEPFVLTAVTKVSGQWNVPEETTAHVSGFIVCDPTKLCHPTKAAQRGWVHWLLRFARLRNDHLRLDTEGGNLRGACRVHTALAGNDELSCTKRFMYRLMEKGDLDLAKWHIRGCDAHLMEEYLYPAVWTGRVDLVEWMHETWADLNRVRHKSTDLPASPTTKTMLNSREASFTAVQMRFASELMEMETLMSRMKQDTSRENVLSPWISLSYNNQFSSATTRSCIQTNLSDLAAVNGQLNVVKQLTRFRNAKCTVSGLFGAITRGHLAIVRHIYASQPELATWPQQEDGPTVLRFFLDPVNREMLQFFRRERNFRLESRDVIEAVSRGDTVRVQLISELDLVEWVAEAVDVASAKGDFDMVQVLYGYKPPGVYCSSRAMDGAAEAGSLPILHFLNERDAPSSRLAMDLAARHGHIDVVRFLHKHRHEGCSPYALLWASARGHGKVVKYLTSQLIHSNLDKYIAVAKEHNHWDVLITLKAHQATYGNKQQSLRCSSRSTARRKQKEQNDDARTGVVNSAGMTGQRAPIDVVRFVSGSIKGERLDEQLSASIPTIQSSISTKPNRPAYQPRFNPLRIIVLEEKLLSRDFALDFREEPSERD